MHVLVERVLYYKFCSKQTSERLKSLFASLIKRVPGYVHYPVSLDGHWSWLTIHRFVHLQSPEFVRLNTRHFHRQRNEIRARMK